MLRFQSIKVENSIKKLEDFVIFKLIFRKNAVTLIAHRRHYLYNKDYIKASSYLEEKRYFKNHTKSIQNSLQNSN